MEETIQKWFLLKSYFKDFYELKLKTWKAYEDIKTIKLVQDNDKSEIKEFYREKDIETVLLQLVQPIINLLFLFRNNSDYIIKLISLIDANQDKPEQIDSLVEFFCNRVYDNILIPNPEHEELLIIIYKLLKYEIALMTSDSTDEFLHDSIVHGKFILVYMNRPELNNFLSILLNPMISSIENKSQDDYLNMFLFAIQNFIWKDLINKN